MCTSVYVCVCMPTASLTPLPQLERKRHLGNDVVMIIFRDSNCTTPFDPTQVRSQFNRTLSSLGLKSCALMIVRVCVCVCVMCMCVQFLPFSTLSCV